MLPELLQELNNTSSTNLSKGEILSLLAAGLQQPSTMRITRLPLRTEGGSPRLDQSQASSVLGRWLSQRPPSDSDTAVAVMGSDPISTGKPSPNSAAPDNRPTRRNCRWRLRCRAPDPLQAGAPKRWLCSAPWGKANCNRARPHRIRELPCCWDRTGAPRPYAPWEGSSCRKRCCSRLPKAASSGLIRVPATQPRQGIALAISGMPWLPHLQQTQHRTCCCWSRA